VLELAKDRVRREMPAIGRIVRPANVELHELGSYD